MQGWAEEDLRFMRRAIEEAGTAASAGEVPVGAVATVGERVLGRASNRSVTDCDPSAHAEVLALREAARAQGNHRLVDVTLYVTLEPCAMCVGAMLQARIRRVVFGAYDPKAGALGSVVDLGSVRSLNHRLEVNGGLLAEECAGLLGEFFEARRDD